MLVKCANFNKIQPIAADKRAHPKASSFLVILFEPSYLKYERLESSTLFRLENPREHSKPRRPT